MKFLPYKDTHGWAWSGRCCAGYLHPNIVKAVLKKKPYMKKPPTSMPRGAARGRIRSGQWAGGLRSCQCEHRLKTPKSGRAGGRQSGLHLATCTLGLNPHRRDAVPPAWGLRRRIFPRELSLRLFSLRGLLTGRTSLLGDTTAPAALPASAVAAPPTSSSLPTDGDHSHPPQPGSSAQAAPARR